MGVVTSWGRLTQSEQNLVYLTDRHSASREVFRAAPGICFGAGRSYGDACLSPGKTSWNMRFLDKFIAFNGETGFLQCEAGVLLRDVLHFTLPRGWFLPVVPGTQMVTVGGAIANDVHGKNHHRFGTFGEHVKGLALLRSDGDVLVCSTNQNSEMLAATIGGIGLTGIILWASLQLRRVSGPWFDVQTTPFYSFEEFLGLSQNSEAGFEYSVAWLDCLSGTEPRGLFSCANHTENGHDFGRPPRQKNFFLKPPFSLVNKATLVPFNMGYFMLGKWRAGRHLQHYQSFLTPLDHIQNWNRMYGPKGFYQYQCRVPLGNSRSAIPELLREIAKSGMGSFLAVLKTMGERPVQGLLSFAKGGVTLALDFPNSGAPVHRLFSGLDAIVSAAGGAIYLAKDARMPRQLFERSYTHFAEVLKYRDPCMSSAMSQRLMSV